MSETNEVVMQVGSKVTIKTYQKGRPPSGIIVEINGEQVKVLRKKAGNNFVEVYNIADLRLA